jgi:soluble lytic murein transglycosylase-like protein
LLFGRLHAGRGWHLGIAVAALIFVVTTGTASAVYLKGGGTSHAVAGAGDPAAPSTANATVTVAERTDWVSGMLPDPARDPNELEATAQSQALLAEREAQVQADAAARAEAEAQAQAEAAAAAQLAAQQREEAAAQAEQARAAAATRAAAQAAAAAEPAATVQATVSSALVDARGSIQQAAASAGWPGELLAKVERVATCESGGRTTAVSSAGYVGLMQVAPWLHGAVPADAVGQLAQAYQVYLQQGWNAWPVCGGY